MAENKWEGARNWVKNANKIAPTLVGGSKKHGDPDLGLMRTRSAWAELEVDGRGVANAAPEVDFEGMPRLTSRMMARIQGFPDIRTFGKKKTTACRMIRNVFPSPVAQVMGERIKECLKYECLNSECEISFSRVVVYILTLTTAGVASNADTSSFRAKAISKKIVDILVDEYHHTVNISDPSMDFETKIGFFFGRAFPIISTIRLKGTAVTCMPKFANWR